MFSPATSFNVVSSAFASCTRPWVATPTKCHLCFIKSSVFSVLANTCSSSMSKSWSAGFVVRFVKLSCRLSSAKTFSISALSPSLLELHNVIKIVVLMVKSSATRTVLRCMIDISRSRSGPRAAKGGEGRPWPTYVNHTPQNCLFYITVNSNRAQMLLSKCKVTF